MFEVIVKFADYKNDVAEYIKATESDKTKVPEPVINQPYFWANVITSKVEKYHSESYNLLWFITTLSGSIYMCFLEEGIEQVNDLAQLYNLAPAVIHQTGSIYWGRDVRPATIWGEYKQVN